MAVFTLRETLAGIGQGGAAAVQTIGVMVGRLCKMQKDVSFHLAFRHERMPVAWKSEIYLLAVIADPSRDDDCA